MECGQEWGIWKVLSTGGEVKGRCEIGRWSEVVKMEEEPKEECEGNI